MLRMLCIRTVPVEVENCILPLPMVVLQVSSRSASCNPPACYTCIYAVLLLAELHDKQVNWNAKSCIVLSLSSTNLM